ncbi:membrane or secreted protein [Pontibacter sp. SGAir0037]|nr:membrane or secreted protein [Pontibacter sp. SGAir0037]
MILKQLQLMPVWLIIYLCLTSASVLAQKKSQGEPDQVYVDSKGILRWKKSKQEAAFFGVNYTVPFAYGYRSVRAMGIKPEQAIEQDVYHMARLGFDAFRVHVWDTEITDTLGNLLENEHLRLFDYLLYQLKERDIKVMLTPIAFWGNGYPEQDEATPGFSHRYGKQKALLNESAFKAQENYLRQLLNHVNPYTKLRYSADANIIGAEVNNEPHHTGAKERATEYVNRMANALRASGWSKPIFYNISESPRYADAVARAKVDGFSFQWYPTGLVANYTIPGNYLPHVDKYQIPFDTIAAFANKALMVYEFDAGDVLGSYMYPSMAKSFREAGFQWATQFAYDPMATAYANTEYQTHYVNLAYTPSKAISLLIASKAFHAIPLRKSFGTYPADSTFGAFRVSYKQSLSEMNTAQEFYYSNSTRTKPVNAAKLEKIAGVGTSAVVQYSGTGAYFIDKLENGVWRLEVMPDAVHIRDPFAKASPAKEVTRIQWELQEMHIALADLGKEFSIQALNQGNTRKATALNGQFQVMPGSYLLLRKGKSYGKTNTKVGSVALHEFVAPQPLENRPFVAHQPLHEVSANRPFSIKAQVAGISPKAKVAVQLSNTAGMYKTVAMEQKEAYFYEATVPADIVIPGAIQYRVMVQDEEKHYTFPGGYEGDPWAWDYYHQDAWQVFVASEKGKLQLFNPTTDRAVFVYPNLWKSDERQLITAEKSGQLILKLTAKELPQEGVLGFQYYIKDKMSGRENELNGFGKLLIRMKTNATSDTEVKVGLISREGITYAARVKAGENYQDIEIPLNALQPAATMLLPRPYPGFQPFWFEGKANHQFELKHAEKLEVRLEQLNRNNRTGAAALSFEVEAVWLEK